MNAAMIKALGLDAVYQVLDNRVFRILLILVVLPVLFTFLFGFHEDEITLLFGLRSWSYDGVLSFLRQFGVTYAGDDADQLIISSLTSLIVEKIVGNFGIIFTIAATAFFVPRMIEKGAADVLFHKPLGRLALYLSRYVSGLLFIGLFSFALVFGMYLGFLLVSGHNDPGILWAAITLTYLFGLVHGVTMLMGVVTRSTVASTLLAILFFFGNGCVHGVWTMKEQGFAYARAARVAAAEAQAAEEGEPAELDEDEVHPFAQALLYALNTFHYVGPKTHDADHLTSLLQRAVEGGREFQDPDSGFAVVLPPPRMESAPPADAATPLAGAGPILGEPVYRAADEDGSRALAVWIREPRMLERTHAGRERTLPERSRDAAEELAELAAAAGHADAEMVDGVISEDARRTSDFGTMFLELSSSAAVWTAGDRREEVAFLRYRDRMIAVGLTLPGELSPEELGEARRDAYSNCGIENVAAEGDWYEEQLGWDAPLKYNLFFSIGSSLAFAATMLLLGWWRLSRIDF